MEKITVLSLLKKYRRWVGNGDIQFLPEGSEQQRSILAHLDGLMPEFEAASKKEGGLSTNLDWYETHTKGRNLWQELVSSALNCIDRDSKGNSALFQYLEKATLFEDLLYGLEPFYRDHTLHSIWDYFIGEYILREALSRIKCSAVSW